MVVSSAGSETDLPACLRRQYDVVHDKGTYDAISLSPENPKEERLGWVSGGWIRGVMMLHGSTEGYLAILHDRPSTHRT